VAETVPAVLDSTSFKMMLVSVEVVNADAEVDEAVVGAEVVGSNVKRERIRYTWISRCSAYKNRRS
jgi:hypothetical protein